jgi:Sulfotransferase domain
MSGEGLKDRIGRATPRVVRTTVRDAARRVGRATASSRVLPDFLVIGAQRAGTTTLYHYLVQHPQVLGAVADKEVHFFDLGFTGGLDAYRAAFPTRNAVRRAARGHARVRVGEATPYYLFHPAVPDRVASSLCDVALIAILRDPVERAWSQYRHEVELGYERRSFEEALDLEAERLAGEEQRLLADPAATSFTHQHHSYVARGRYLEQLERWWRALPADRLLLVRSEDLHADPRPTFDAICSHLDIDVWRPPVWRTYNASSTTGMEAGTRARLREAFREDNERLSAATGRDWAWHG